MKRHNFLNTDLPYALYTPEVIDPDIALPLILFLHGLGERGTDLALVDKWGVPKYIEQGNELSAIVLAPQCPDTSENWTAHIGRIISLIDSIEAEYNISKTHICGFSMGGHGTQYTAVHYPDRFTAIAPVATYMYPSADINDEVCVLKDKALWIFHSEADFVPVAHSDTVVSKLRDCHASNLTYTRYTEPDHTQTADLAFLDEEFYRWILAQ